MNPLLSTDFLIPFNEIKAQDIESGIKEAITKAEETLATIASAQAPYSYDSTLGALEEMLEQVSRAVVTAYHMTSVATTPEIREAFNKVLPDYSSFFAKLPLNPGLWQVLKNFSDSENAKDLGPLQRRYLEKTLRDFKRAGANLDDKTKARVETIQVELSKLQTKFSENVLDATNAYELILTDEKDLAGLPESAIRQARANAESKNLEGYRFTLQAPSFLPFIKHAENRALRQQFYTAYINRASAGDFDNRKLIPQILELRQELAHLLGYETFADYRLEENMVGSGKAALAFENDLFEATLPYWHSDLEKLKSYAKDLGIDKLEPWDVNYVSEKLRKAKFDFDDEALRPFFPLNRVMEGMFQIGEKLFGIKIKETPNEKVWHEDVKFYDIYDRQGEHIASFYADLFPRENKRGGAWMNAFITGQPTEAGFSPHLGLIAANFTPPQDGQPALLTHDEVQTTFHEFGHLLHHCLSRVEVRPLAGTHVPWDFVELPSQIMENWTWEREALDLFARHVDTGETIPENLFTSMKRARTFMESNAQMRQLSFGTVDLELHIHYQADKDGNVIDYGNKIMERFAIEKHFVQNNFLAAFGHIFSGGYAAGYYSYKWSEVLDADAFSRFKQEGIFNPKTGQDFLKSILSQGNSKDVAEQFRDFMGRDPNVKALLERNLGQKAKPAVA